MDRCPICTKPVKQVDKQYPFCSARCCTQDLANWSSGKYVVHTAAPISEEDDSVPPATSDPEQE